MIYFHLAYIQQTLGVLQRSDSLLTQVQEAAEARYRVGQGNQQDVLKAQLQHTKILQEIAHHHRKKDCWKPRSSRSWAVHRSPRTSLPRPSRCELFRTPRPNSCSGSRAESRCALKAGLHSAAGTQVELAHKEFRRTSMWATRTSTTRVNSRTTTWRALVCACRTGAPARGIGRGGTEPGARTARAGR